jgi:hypothetical protein
LRINFGFTFSDGLQYFIWKKIFSKISRNLKKKTHVRNTKDHQRVPKFKAITEYFSKVLKIVFSFLGWVIISICNFWFMKYRHTSYSSSLKIFISIVFFILGNSRISEIYFQQNLSFQMLTQNSAKHIFFDKCRTWQKHLQILLLWVNTFLLNTSLLVGVFLKSPRKKLFLDHRRLFHTAIKQ